MSEKKNSRTPEETAQTLSEFAKKLEELDKTEGIFGEAVTDDDLEGVAGGALLNPSYNPTPAICDVCGHAFGANYPPKECLGGGAAYECPYVKTGR